MRRTITHTAIIGLAILFIAFAFLLSPKTKKIEVPEVKAQTTQDAGCVGDALAEYLRTVATTAGTLNNIQLLSPAFNMTNPNGAAIAAAMTAADPGWISLVSGIAGNAYNCCGNLITGHVQTFRDLSLIATKPVLLTETGVYDLGIAELKSELDIIQSNNLPGRPYLGAILFNGFKTAEDQRWDRFGFDSDSQILNDVCGGSCEKIGVNSAVFYGSENIGGDPADFYERAEKLGMSFTLSIANPDVSTIDGVKLALEESLTPVIRIGTAESAGPDAISYGKFLQTVDQAITAAGLSGTVYAIAGPNEPQSECWAAPGCGCDLSPVVWEDNIDRPVEKGFVIDRYQCTDTANPEFHPLRPYPANACDPLIPRSDPEAPTVTLEEILRKSNDNIELADYQRYNTFACGSNMEFSHLEGFDPYGFVDKYDENDTVGIIEDSFGNQFLHTYCETPTEEQQKTTGAYSQVCYRTVGYNIYTDFSNTNIGILGNTQNKNFTEEQKVNNYLSWYFTGTTQIGDNVLLDPDEEEDIDRLINFSGPVRKLLPYEAVQLVREVLRFAVNEPTYDIHDYALNNQQTIRISTVNESLSEFFPHIPNSTLEDIAGETFFTSYGGFGVGARGPEATVATPEPLTTAPYSLNITCAVGANQDCPPTGPFRVGGSSTGGTGGSGTCLATPNGECLAPGESCCETESFDLSCAVTETRCVAACSATPNGECLAPGESCCGTESFDLSCAVTETRCVAG